LRLDRIQNYGNGTFDAGIDRAVSTLMAVRDGCTTMSGELMDVGWRRSKVVVDILEARYNDAITTRETFEAKAHASLRLMEGVLADLEARANGFSAVMDRGRQKASESLKSARGAMDEGLERARQAKEALRISVESAVQRAREHGLLGYDDLPAPWRGNPHILRGYRFCESQLDCVQSAFKLSNETVNIWSHAIGLMVILSIAFYFYPTSAHWPLSSKTDVFFAALFFFAACKCLVCSIIWHTMSSISNQTVMERFACVDYTGISLLIAATIMSTEYTAFYCEPASRGIYIFMTAIFGLAGIIVPWHPFFNRHDMSGMRVLFYVSFGATGFFPMVQLCMTRGAAWCFYFYGPMMKSIFVYLIGATIYAAKIPEKFFPGGFDYIGCSHNIWHLAVLMGIIFHYSAMYEMYSSAFNRAEYDCLAF
jgi:adiponectin receptor